VSQLSIDGEDERDGVGALMATRKDQGKPTELTPAVDEQIIKGFFGDLEAMIKVLCMSGFKREEILERAEFLGLNRTLVKACTKPEDLLVRRCLKCDREFLSLGPQNRLCRVCKGKM
jgi:hypothetical protein